MARYIQVGVTAMRDPVNPEIMLPAVPLYIRAEDQEILTKAATRNPAADQKALYELAKSFGAYMDKMEKLGKLYT